MQLPNLLSCQPVISQLPTVAVVVGLRIYTVNNIRVSRSS